MDGTALKPKMTVLFAAILILATVLMAGCNFSLEIQPQVRTGWVGNHLPGMMDYRYAYFNGYEQARMSVDAGQQIEVSYQATVEKGTLSLEIQDQGRNSIWARSLEKDGEGTYTLPVDQKGDFRIRVVGKDTAGSFKLAWKVDQEP